MTSAIDPTKPTAVVATTQSVRDNFLAAKSEIEALQTAVGTAQFDITALQGDVATKQATLVSGTNIKTLNGASLLGAGDIVITGGSGSASLPPGTTAGQTLTWDGTAWVPSFGITPDDTYAAQTVLMLDMDGTPGATTVTDSSAAARTVVTNGTGCALTASRRRVGSTSMVLTGSGFLTAAGATEFDLTSGDVTIEAFTYVTDSSGYKSLFASTTGPKYLGCLWNGRYGLWLSDNGTAFNVFNPDVNGIGAGPTGYVKLSTWQHVAYQRKSGVWTIHVDGELTYRLAQPGNILANADGLTIGRYLPNSTLGWVGHIDEFRFTKAARYPDNGGFTPPATLAAPTVLGAPGPQGPAGTGIAVGASAPATPTLNQLWLDTN